MARESVHAKLERVRPPRVHVTYNVEIGDAIELKEIPFVMGILADLSGQPADPLPKIKDRRFVEITPDNFDSVLESMKPRVAFSVENKLSEEANAGNIGVDLTFKSIEDFEPEQVARRVGPLRELLDLRTKLSDLVGTLQGNEKLERLLQDVISNTGKMEQVRAEMEQQKTQGGRAPWQSVKLPRNTAAAAAPAPAPVTAPQTPSLLDQIVTEGRVGRDASAAASGDGAWCRSSSSRCWKGR